ncbi:MAG: hypothetical protein AAB539_01865 [Patescibacteria group bacterium]
MRTFIRREKARIRNSGVAPEEAREKIRALSARFSGVRTRKLPDTAGDKRKKTDGAEEVSPRKRLTR